MTNCGLEADRPTGGKSFTGWSLRSGGLRLIGFRWISCRFSEVLTKSGTESGTELGPSLARVDTEPVLKLF